MSEIAPFGSWKSPVTPELVTRTPTNFPPAGTLGGLTLEGDETYWLATRPDEGGRSVLVRRSAAGEVKDMMPREFNARSRVHEYGGGAATVADGVIYFSNFSDQRLYRNLPGVRPRALTPPGLCRYADVVVDVPRGRLLCIREDHSRSDREPVNSIVEVSLEGQDPGREIVRGKHFYSTPRLSADGNRLAWLGWNHPLLPWDGTELWVGELGKDGSVVESRLVAGGERESIFQPEWSPDGTLYFVSDRTGWWNLYRFKDDEVEQVVSIEAEMGKPQWTFGHPTYAIESPERIVCLVTERGMWKLGVLDVGTGQLDFVEMPYTDLWSVAAAPGFAVFGAGSPGEPPALVRLDLASRELEVLHRSREVDVPTEYLSPPEELDYPTADGESSHAFFYRPRNPDFDGEAGELPPLVVMTHGGPTSTTWTTWRLDIQYWTSRGVAVLDVNYRGSSGYGRTYRERLYGNWGKTDLDDCTSGVRFLVERGDVDADRVAIRGASAGGYTTLCALTFGSGFRAGASYFGVSDLEALAQETHKFESQYISRLVGPWPIARRLYRARSPLHHVDRLDCPVIFFQGLDDKVIPPNQAERMVAALRSKGIPVAYVPFKEEGHGFRKAANIQRALEAELYFYSRVFGFDTADAIEPVPIEGA